jgi:beta-fructofuranosidase
VVAEPGAVVGLELDGEPVWPDGLTVSRVFIDGSLVEVFLADGGTLTTRAYPDAASRWRLTGDVDRAQVYSSEL